jgi:hypothetical protein
VQVAGSHTNITLLKNDLCQILKNPHGNGFLPHLRRENSTSAPKGDADCFHIAQTHHPKGHKFCEKV